MSLISVYQPLYHLEKSLLHIRVTMMKHLSRLDVLLFLCFVLALPVKESHLKNHPSKGQNTPLFNKHKFDIFQPLYIRFRWNCFKLFERSFFWATAFIYFHEKMMWRKAGFEKSLVSPAKRDQNEMGGIQNRIGDVHHVYEHVGVHYYTTASARMMYGTMKPSRQGNRQMADKVRLKKTRSKTRSKRDTPAATAVLDKY